ncbi:uncharacterized protein I206_101459 [Kwoniella pini CBS 10737]|uniref:PIG-P domain-containing protein n=1 Tax=Kwoniella pini CBS 10737 TaxID=1296096 RepID=A0A1B9HWL2_9TREE|nr:uncharacterized protein I206_06569 [Kwoniella pini CBS 10737]OCF47664.1 hypothetical protein I206_06569 [Kwoniella pini CBS 10737]
MTSTPITPQRSSTPSPTIDPISPLSPISPWPPISSSTFLENSEKPQSDLPNAVDVYSSIAILGTYLLFGLYIIWSFSPKDIKWLNWLPDRQWAIIIPCWIIMVFLLTYWSYAALTIYRTPNWDSIDCITDSYSGIPSGQPVNEVSDSQVEEPYYWKMIDEQASSEVVDLPIDLVGRVLYPPRRRKTHSSDR